MIVYKNSQILTKNGYETIDDLEQKNNRDEIKIWNGNKWILIKIKRNIITEKNLTNSKYIYKILLSDGCELLCSELQSLNIIKINEFNLSEEINQIHMENIKVNDLLYTYEFPVIDSVMDILYPYTHGYYCGCLNKIDTNQTEIRFESNLIYINLIDDKQKLKSKIEITGKYTINKSTISGLLKVDMDKNITAPINGSIENKLIWLSGLIDNNGFITKLCDAKYLNISVLSKKFAMEIKFLFNTLGINPHIYLKSDIRKFKSESGEVSEIIKHYWVILLNSEDTNKIFLESEFDLKIFYLKYDKSFYSIDQDISRYLSIKKINKIQLKKESFIISGANSCIVNGVLIN